MGVSEPASGKLDTMQTLVSNAEDGIISSVVSFASAPSTPSSTSGALHLSSYSVVNLQGNETTMGLPPLMLPPSSTSSTHGRRTLFIKIDWGMFTQKYKLCHYKSEWLTFFCRTLKEHVVRSQCLFVNSMNVNNVGVCHIQFKTSDLSCISLWGYNNNNTLSSRSTSSELMRARVITSSLWRIRLNIYAVKLAKSDRRARCQRAEVLQESHVGRGQLECICG